MPRWVELTAMGLAMIIGVGCVGLGGRAILNLAGGKVQGAETSQFVVASGMHYTSEALGLSFFYADSQNGDKIAVKEDDNKVYVYDTLGSYTDGQYVEVMSKDPKDSLDEAIKKQVLQNYDPANCPIKYVGNGLTAVNATMQVATLNYDPKKNPDHNSFSGAVASTCPGQYTSVGGVNYFAMDSSYPDKLLFVAAGQYPIMAGTDPLVKLTWHDTLTVF